MIIHPDRLGRVSIPNLPKYIFVKPDLLIFIPVILLFINIIAAISIQKGCKGVYLWQIHGTM